MKRRMVLAADVDLERRHLTSLHGPTHNADGNVRQHRAILNPIEHRPEPPRILTHRLHWNTLLLGGKLEKLGKKSRDLSNTLLHFRMG
jgi:hypothetical protein